MFELSNELLVQVLLFVLVFFVTSYVLTKFLKNRGISIIVGLVVSIFSVYFLSYSQIILLMKTYGATGITVLILVPFVIAFFFIYSSDIGGVLRKMFWVFYGIMNILLLQEETSLSSDTTTSAAISIVFLVAILLLFDVTIKNKINVLRNLRRRK